MVVKYASSYPSSFLFTSPPTSTSTTIMNSAAPAPTLKKVRLHCESISLTNVYSKKQQLKSVT